MILAQSIETFGGLSFLAEIQSHYLYSKYAWSDSGCPIALDICL